MARSANFRFEIRLATQDEINEFKVNANTLDGTAIVLVDGEVVAFTDEYGTATMVHERTPHSREAVERMVEAAGDLYDAWLM